VNENEDTRSDTAQTKKRSCDGKEAGLEAVLTAMFVFLSRRRAREVGMEREVQRMLDGLIVLSEAPNTSLTL